MLFAYMTFESATYTQKALSSHRNGRNAVAARLRRGGEASRPEPVSAASAGAMRSSGEALILS